MSPKKIYVLDTSVYLTNADAIYAFKTHDIYVPLKVFEEIDKHKKRQDLVGAQARKIIRIWDELRDKGSLKEGVLIREGLGLIRSVSASDIDRDDLPPDLDIKIPDHLIIATARTVARESERQVILVSRDINMRVIADAIGLPCEDFQNHLTDPSLLNGIIPRGTLLINIEILSIALNKERIPLFSSGKRLIRRFIYLSFPFGISKLSSPINIWS